MAFAGNMGAATAMTPIAVMTAPGGALSYDSDGITLLKTDTGTVTPIRRPSLANLRFTMADDQGPPLAAAVVPGGPNAANADTGLLVTSDPAGTPNSHGIPANFGPGRGNWTQDDLERLEVRVMTVNANQGAAGDGGVVAPTNFTLAAGDIAILMRNYSELGIASMIVELEYRHSIEIG